jgi:hypothetical protein
MIKATKELIQLVLFVTTIQIKLLDKAFLNAKIRANIVHLNERMDRGLKNKNK